MEAVSKLPSSWCCACASDRAMLAAEHRGSSWAVLQRARLMSVRQGWASESGLGWVAAVATERGTEEQSCCHAVCCSAKSLQATSKEEPLCRPRLSREVRAAFAVSPSAVTRIRWPFTAGQDTSRIEVQVYSGRLTIHSVKALHKAIHPQHDSMEDANHPYSDGAQMSLAWQMAADMLHSTDVHIQCEAQLLAEHE